MRLAVSNHHPDYPPPAFVDEVYLKEVEEAIESLSRKHVPEHLHETLFRAVPTLIQEIRHLRERLGRSDG